MMSWGPEGSGEHYLRVQISQDAMERLTQDQGKALLERMRSGRSLNGVKKPAKYRNTKVAAFDLEGTPIKFDSKKEARRWSELCRLREQGLITDLERQVVYKFNGLIYKSKRAVKYVADFRYRLVATTKVIVEDAKGMKTDLYKLKWALMKRDYGIEIQEV